MCHQAKFSREKTLDYEFRMRTVHQYFNIKNKTSIIRKAFINNSLSVDLLVNSIKKIEMSTFSQAS